MACYLLMADNMSKYRICSYQKASPAIPILVYYNHDSARSVRIMQEVEYEQSNKDYFSTIPGATISDILLAWRLDYHRKEVILGL